MTQSKSEAKLLRKTWEERTRTKKIMDATLNKLGNSAHEMSEFLNNLNQNSSEEKPLQEQKLFSLK